MIPTNPAYRELPVLIQIKPITIPQTMIRTQDPNVNSSGSIKKSSGFSVTEGGGQLASSMQFWAYAGIKNIGIIKSVMIVANAFNSK